MTPRVLSGSTRFERLRALIGRHPIISTAIGGFVAGFVMVAIYLMPGVMARSESAVPNVVGLLFNDAAARLSAAGFTAKTGESLHHQTAPKSSVLGQSPAPGVKALKGDDVTLDVSLGAKKGVVPDLIGLSRQDAIAALETAGFDAPTDFVERLNSRPRGEVLAVTPAVGTTLVQPSTVRLTLSAGPDAVGVPSLVGMPLEDALALLGQLGLVAGPSRDDTSGAQPVNFVVSQRPAANTPVSPGSSVTLTVSQPRIPPDSIEP
ncbi:MAG: PASTA domain-containing protein [Gemmatimonadota bacterium]